MTMPKLLLFVPCQRIIVSADDQTLTLVSLVDGVNAPMADGKAPSVADLSWEHLTVWQPGPDDEGQEYEQRLEIVRPDRGVAADVRQRFAMPGRPLRVRGSVVGFPADVEGDYVLRLSLRHVLDADVWQRMGEYPVTVRHVPQAEPPDSPDHEPPALPPAPPTRRRAAPGTRGAKCPNSR
jgi:hypothetical protein